MQTRFDAIVLAGHDLGASDPLTRAFNQPHKALIPLGTRPMVAYVVDSLVASGCIDRIVVVGLSEQDGSSLAASVELVPEQGSLLANIDSGCQRLAAAQDPARHALLVMADTPLLTGEMVAWFLEQCRPYDHDLYWGIVERAVMEMLFPASKRSYLRTVEGAFCSGDLFLGRLAAAQRAGAPLQRLLAHRKQVLAQLRLLGWRVILRYLTGRLRLHELVNVGERLLALRGAPVILPFAEAGMDVDKPHQYAQVLAYMEAHPDQYPALHAADGHANG